ncbi:MAG: hypothetical protein SA339_08490 [Methanomassiliicoccus sp.]|nr:hypothetical protein [Methanomassiliicoccus sp.]
MKPTYKMMVIGAVGALMVAGLAIALLIDQNDVTAVGSETPAVSIQSYGSNVAGEAVQVSTAVDGESVPLSGVQVNICRMNITSDGEHLTFRVMEMTTLMTDANGKAMYNFSDGSKYMICAENQQMRGFTSMNMNDTEANLCYAHQWQWNNMNGQAFTEHGYGQDSSIGSGSGANESVTRDPTQGRVMA